MDSTPRIEKTVTLKAPQSRVWRALTDFREFGQWFGLELAGPFVEGRPVAATFNQPCDEAAIGAMQQRLGLSPAPIRQPPPGFTFCTVERIRPESDFSFRWIPFGIEAGIDPATEPTTLVEFHLEPVEGGTRLVIVESGFERVPPARRRRAFLMNDAGWAVQAGNIQRQVEAHAESD